MATIKMVLRKKKRADGTYPLALRITEERKTSYIYIKRYILERDWDADTQRVRKSHPNAVRLNHFIATKIAQAGDVTLELDTQQKEVSAQGIKRKIRPAADTLFFARATLFLQRLKDTGNYNRWRTDAYRLRVFKEFVLGTEAVRHEWPARARAYKHAPCPGVLGGPDVGFHQIDVPLLTQFTVYMKSRRGVGDRTIVNCLSAIQILFSEAIREGVVDKKHYPFGEDKIQIKIPPTLKVGLTKADVERLETLELSVPDHATVRDLWLISFYFAGMRAGDLFRLRWRDFCDGRLHYVMGKNKKPGSLKTPEKAQRILERYAASPHHPDDFVFPYLEGCERMESAFALKRRIAGAIAHCDRLLREHVKPAAGIEGTLSLHVSRHTFATIAADRIPIQELQKLYRHSNILTTIGYQAAFMHRDADDALDKVLGE